MLSTGMNSLNYRIYDVFCNLIGVVLYAEDAAALLALRGVGTHVRMGPSQRSTVFTVTKANEDEVADSIDWTANEILEGQVSLKVVEVVS